MPFASAEDVATRLGRDLTAEEGGQVDLLLELATGAITAAVDKTDAWATSYTPSRFIELLTVELVIRSMRNPGGLRSRSETLGQYQASETFADPGKGGGIFLSESEELLVRRAVYGSNSGSAKTESVVHDIYPCVGS